MSDNVVPLHGERLAKAAQAASSHIGTLMKAQKRQEADLAELQRGTAEVRQRIEKLERDG